MAVPDNHLTRRGPQRLPDKCSPPKDVDENIAKSRKVIGRTASGVVFDVPRTSDMVSTILDPREPKTVWDLLIIGLMLGHVGLYHLTSGTFRRGLFLFLFAFWRVSYNVGIGYILYQQSHYNIVVKKAQEYGIFDSKQNPDLYAFIEKQLSHKMGKDFVYGSAPDEYLTWLLFRRVVDLVLMLDFCSYVLLASCWSYVPQSQGILSHLLRWTIGCLLILFNLWVKLDANRVVGPVGAWHWADFFYLTDADLTFDGVYELCMHPMYSLGYVGYYGISLLACSYAVLFTSIFAHISQFVFLYVVEEPHIDRTYNPKSPVEVRSRGDLARNLMSTEKVFEPRAPKMQAFDHEQYDYNNVKVKLRGQIFRAFDPFRSTDLTQVLIVICGLFFALFTPQIGSYRSFSICQAFVWRCIHFSALLYTLKGQSNRKMWTAHFLKFGESPKKAWQEWKSIYALSLTVLHTTFLIAAWKSYSIPSDWQYSTVTLRHVLGVALVLMHIWTSISIYDVLGDFGWYFGDFFVDQTIPKLKYTGVYRYLNNPERVVWSFWGFALMSNSNAIITLALQAQVFNLILIELLEKPHMRKLYGKQIRREAGFTKSLKSMPIVDHPQIKRQVEHFEVSLDRVVDTTINSIADYLERARPRFDQAVKETKIKINHYQNCITITSVVDSQDLDVSQYKLLRSKNASNKYGFGEPIRIDWKAPSRHGKKDWIAIYKLTDNTSKEVTRISSKGRWSAIHTDAFLDHNDNIVDDQETEGSIELRGDTLPWTAGTYELRYHHDGKHNVMAISDPLEISVEPSNETSYHKIEQDLLSFVRQIMSSEKGTKVPRAAEDEIEFADEAEKWATRIAYGIRKRYGIEFAWQLLATDASIRNYTARIARSRKILAPFVRYDNNKEV